jgi:hypothetical protein
MTIFLAKICSSILKLVDGILDKANYSILGANYNILDRAN